MQKYEKKLKCKSKILFQFIFIFKLFKKMKIFLLKYFNVFQFVVVRKL